MIRMKILGASFGWTEITEDLRIAFLFQAVSSLIAIGTAHGLVLLFSEFSRLLHLTSSASSHNLINVFKDSCCRSTAFRAVRVTVACC